ncbi:hypothetical protein Tsubulata_001005 [Turnera subulata]|uniref:F-box/LRR-repeat protein 15-like leucin rich repeat domain-containing protein n=1 Tax=Turnera subulata TaxID=218843 RepID=A0A9Q0J5L0_9ROSI|nr:hypothetical protein Tsubulata_001005 [Turnera subulata]
MGRLPSNLIAAEILRSLELETVCTVACVSPSLRFAVDSLVFPSLSSLDLSSFSLDPHTLHHILSRCSSTSSLEHLSLNCQRLRDSSLAPLLPPRITHLYLSRCSSLSPPFLFSIGQNCPSLKVLELELPPSLSYSGNLTWMLGTLQSLECLSIRVKGGEIEDARFLFCIEGFLPPSLKTLKLKPVLQEQAFNLATWGSFRCRADEFGPSASPSPPLRMLQCLSLVLDVISDGLLFAIATSLPLLIDLHLEDRPTDEPSAFFDLTNPGLQNLGYCHHLEALSLVRSRKHYQGSFRRVNDLGFFLLSETCRNLQSLTLSGFSKVSDAGFASLLHSCQRLSKFEFRNAMTLSDLAFQSGTSSVLVEVRLLSCTLITSETVNQLAYCQSLEVLDLCGCKSVADSCLGYVSCLPKLRKEPPITHLYLRACKRVTDRGISLLFNSGGTIGQTLSTLDIGYLPGISDQGICMIADAATQLTELCIRCCYHVTDSSLQALGTRSTRDGSKQLRTLDLFNCIGLNADALKLLRVPLFRGIRWIGIGQTRLSRRNAVTAAIRNERPWLTLCFDGCEMGCHNGWHFHRSEDY